MGDLRGVNAMTVARYLEHCQPLVGQKTLDLDRQAAHFLLRQNYGQKVQLPRIQSTCKQGRRLSEESRAYFPEQVEMIARSLPASSSLAVRIAHATGVRARELLTLRRAEHVPASTRRLWSEARFSGRTGLRYTVRGKGGLRREVLIPTALANELEQRRLSRIHRVKDRGTVYWTEYKLAGGSYLSRLFSRKSKELLDWSGAAWAETRLCTRTDGRTYANRIFKKRPAVNHQSGTGPFPTGDCNDLLALMFISFWED